MRQRRILAIVATFALAASGAMTALAPAVDAGPSGGSLLPPRADSDLVRGSNGAVHAVVPAEALVRPAGLARNAAPAAVAKAFLATKAKAFGATASDLRPTQTVRQPSGGSTVRFQQKLGGMRVLGGELVVSLDADGALRSITGEAVRGSAPTDVRTKVPAADQTRRARAFVAKRTGAKHLTAQRVDTVVFNPALLGLPNGIDVNLSADRFLVSGSARTSYTVFVNDRLGVLGSFPNNEEADNRSICGAGNQSFFDPNDAYCVGTNPNIRVSRYEGGPVSSDADTNTVFDNLGYTQRAYTDFADFDLAPNIGLTGAEANGSGDIERLRATVHYCDVFDDCPMANAFWNDTFDPDTGAFVGGQMYYGVGVTQDDITGHEVSHGVTSATSNLLYWFQSGAINESMSDVFGELIDLVDSNYGSLTEPSADAWKIGEGSSLGVIRSMKNPPSVIQGTDPQTGNDKGQPDKMTSSRWWDVGWDLDSGGVHLNSGVGNKTAYLIAAGGAFNGQTVRALGYAKTFAIYWATENLLTSGADYRDLYTTLPIACTQSVGTRFITADDCAQVRKAVAATELAKSPRATQNLPVRTSYCSTGQTVKTAMYQGFDDTPTGWAGVRLAKRDIGFDYVKTGTDSAYVDRGSAHPMRQTTGVVVPAGGKLRITYAVLADEGTHGMLRFRISPTGPLHNLPATNSVNRGPWGTSPGWSSAKWDLSAYAGRRIYLHFNTDESSGTTAFFVDNVRVYSCL